MPTFSNLLRLVPSKLPLEDTVDRGLDRVAKAIARNPITEVLSGIHTMLPSLPEVPTSTPLGEIHLPEVSAPIPYPPQVDARRREAIKAAVGTDLSSVIGIIPWVGDVASDIIEDIFGAKIKRTLTPGEYNTYLKYDKLGPSTYAMLRTFTRR